MMVLPLTKLSLPTQGGTSLLNSASDGDMVWSPAAWDALDSATAQEALRADESGAWRVVTRQARYVLRTYSTSFFIVTRFLPPAKRAQVEAIYAAVRYPDEIVDSFPWTQEMRMARLDGWRLAYERSLELTTLHECLEKKIPPFVAAFSRVVRTNHIPPEHYLAFLDAMRLDAEPRRFVDLKDLIDSYIYGSAIVVGYFLTYVYGSARPDDFDRALRSARNLGIALQLTNFLRDVAEDQRRGRQYIPEDMLRKHCLHEVDVHDSARRYALCEVLAELRGITESYYAAAAADIDAFAEDSRVAIRACIDVYRELNNRIGTSADGVAARESVPLSTKFRVLPASKYWRLPLAYLTR
jgi:15-cis-phytoene synthase